MAKLLLVEDDVDAAEMVADWLKLQNYIVDAVHNGKDAVEYLQAYPYDLVILDWDIPSISGVEVCRQFRAAGGTTPVIMLTGKSAVSNKEEGLDSGADDYLTKPFDMKELSARIRALLRRPTAIRPTSLEAGDINMNPATFQVTRGGKQIQVTPKEYALLEFFLRHPNEVFSTEALLDRVWSTDSEATPLTVRVCITRLRSKIDTEGSPSLIVNVHGVGYKLQTES